MSELARVVEALIFLSPEPLSVEELARAAECGEDELRAALGEIAPHYEPGARGIALKELAGGYTFASEPVADEAARRLFGRVRLAKLTQAQAETMAIVAYLQPISRPEIARIRGVNADHAVAALHEHDLIEESGRSQFGAALYGTTTTFLKLFGLGSLEELPDITRFDPSAEEASELRERLLRAGEARAGSDPQAA